MNRFRKIAVALIIIEVLITVILNFAYFKSANNANGKPYRVEASRIERCLLEDKEFDINDYPSIISVHEFDPSQIVNNDYVIVKKGDTYYQIEYRISEDNSVLIYMNIGLGFMLIMSTIILAYVDSKIIKPFNRMSDVSVELAKGNLTAHVKEDKNKFFGKFMWGIDMLRDNLESNKEKELQLQKEKKTLILSLSHDIKTPLSAIKLYSKALKEGLYDSKEKQDEAILGIERNTIEIEKYVSDIVAASREDFLNLEVKNGEFYLSEVIEKIEVLYKEKFSTLHTEFKIERFDNFLLHGDINRLEEVLQNLLENAIKYGDGRYVKISFADEEDCCLIEVRNSGCTLKEAEVPHLFESFYRGTNTDGVKGSGLGLYIVRSLLKLMDGDCYAQVDGDEFVCVAVVKHA